MRISRRRRQIIVAIASVLIVAAACYPISDWVGYRSVALILLLTVSVLAMVMHLTAVVIAAVLSALVWDFFFIPPHFTLTIGSGEDALLIFMYFIVALLNAVINYRLRALEKVERQKDEREKTIRLYDTVFNSLSHELRTPLASVMGATDMLIEHDAALSITQKNELLQTISKGGLRLHEQVENLLNVSRLEAGVITAQKTWCDLAELIYETANQTCTEGRAHQTDILIPDNLPLVQLDFGLSLQALKNLLENAYRHTPPGAIVRIDAAILPSQHFKYDHELQIVVSDNGPGFTTDEKARVFERFFRSGRSASGGTGLGLYIVKGFIEAQGGLINLSDCNAGAGARFVISIPTNIRTSL